MTTEKDSEQITGTTVVRRDVGLAAGRDEAWDLIGEGDGWERWLVDEAAVEVVPGSGGKITDDAVERHVTVTRVEPGRAVEFVWWRADDPASASSVSLTLDEGNEGVVLHVVESFPPSMTVAAARAALRWEVRALAVGVVGLARVVV